MLKIIADGDCHHEIKRPLILGRKGMTNLESKKAEGTRHQIANICWIIKKARKFQKNIYFCFIDYTKAFDYVKLSCSLMSNPL